MNTGHFSFTRKAVLAAVLLSAALVPVVLRAEPPPRHEGEPPRRDANVHREPAREVARDPRYGSAHWQLDARFHHDHYYPARGYVVSSLPPGRLEIMHGGNRYYYHAGVWFRPNGPRWVVVAPPIGIFIPILPIGYSTLYWRGVPYYYADDVYYVRAGASYQVVEAPPANEITLTETPPSATVYATAPTPVPVPVPTAPPRPSAPADGMFVYPKNGQTETQTAFDRIECVKWAIGQTGFDPSQPSGDATARGNFQRAASACLEARGYSVK